MEHILAERYIQYGFAGFCVLLLLLLIVLIRVLIRLTDRCATVIANNTSAMTKVERTGEILLRMMRRARRRAEESCPIDPVRKDIEIRSETA